MVKFYPAETKAELVAAVSLAKNSHLSCPCQCRVYINYYLLTIFEERQSLYPQRAWTMAWLPVDIAMQ